MTRPLRPETLDLLRRAELTAPGEPTSLALLAAPAGPVAVVPSGSDVRLHCPRCASPAIQPVALAPSLATAAVAALAGVLVVESGRPHVVNRCTACGAEWVPGSPREEAMRALAGQLGTTAQQVARTVAAPPTVPALRLGRGAKLAVAVALLALLVVVLGSAIARQLAR